jgi:hypothetical protein
MHIRIAVLLASMVTTSHAATTAQIMSSRYLRYQLCMQRELGNDFYERYGLDHVINRWGVTEMTAIAARSAPAEVRRRDLECRRLNELSSELQPHATGLTRDPTYRKQTP